MDLLRIDLTDPFLDPWAESLREGTGDLDLDIGLLTCWDSKAERFLVDLGPWFFNGRLLSGLIDSLILSLLEVVLTWADLIDSTPCWDCSGLTSWYLCFVSDTFVWLVPSLLTFGLFSLWAEVVLPDRLSNLFLLLLVWYSLTSSLLLLSLLMIDSFLSLGYSL